MQQRSHYPRVASALILCGIIWLDAPRSGMQRIFESMPARLAYIVAAGHSGSTLLDLVVGSIPGAFSTGEVTYLPWQISRKEPGGPNASLQKICSCGSGFHECPAWKSIIAELSRRVGFDVYADPFRFRLNLLQNERFHAGAFSPDRLRRSLYIAACRISALSPVVRRIETSFCEPVQNNWLLFDVIAEVMGRDLIVDSSKSELRLKLLHQARPAETYALVLFRDIRGFCYSRKKLGDDPVRAARGWVRQYNRIWHVLQAMPQLKVICVTYERLTNDPAAERARIGRFLGIEDLPADFVIDTSSCHLAAGNSMKHQGVVEIRSDDAWRGGHTPEDLARIMQIEHELNPGWRVIVAKASGR